MSYKGWDNYATWCVKSWFDNEPDTPSYMKELAADHRDDENHLAQLIREYVEEWAPDLGASIYSDLLRSAIDAVDWAEIAAAYIAALPEIEDEA